MQYNNLRIFSFSDGMPSVNAQISSDRWCRWVKSLQMAVHKVKVPDTRPMSSEWRVKDSEKYVESVV